MSVTAPAEVRRDAKADWCLACFDEDHDFCTYGKCQCPGIIGERRHKRMPTVARKPGTTRPAPVTIPPTPKPDPTAAEAICGYCRGRRHQVCRGGSCTCTKGSHPNRRPAPAPVAPPHPQADALPDAESPLADVERRAQASAAPASKASTPPKAAAKLREPVWQLVKADPPAPPAPKPKRLTVVERARPFVEQIVAEGDRDWYRFAIFPSSMAAAQCRARIAKAYPEFEFKAVRVAEIGQSALYRRWTGKRPAGQL